jgi:hypothetical protein
MGVCDSSVVKKKMVVTWGQSIHLGCFLKMPEVLSSQTVTWFHYNKEKGRYQIVYRSGSQSVFFKYSITPIIQVNLDCELSRYAENPDN